MTVKNAMAGGEQTIWKALLAINQEIVIDCNKKDLTDARPFNLMFKPIWVQLMMGHHLPT